MARRKTPPTVDISGLIEQAAVETAERLSHRIANYKQNREVLLLLFDAGLTGAESCNSQTACYGSTFEIRQSKLLEARKALGTLKERRVDLVDAKKRIIRVTLEAEQFPSSDVYISYRRRYTKDDELNSPCKIQRVELRPAQEAMPAEYTYALVCNKQA